MRSSRYHDSDGESEEAASTVMHGYQDSTYPCSSKEDEECELRIET